MNFQNPGLQKTREEESSCDETKCATCIGHGGCIYRMHRHLLPISTTPRKKDSWWKKIGFLSILLASLLAACASDARSESSMSTTGDKPEKGYARGRITDAKGNPLAGVSVYVDNSMYFNSGVSTVTDAKGYYRVAVPQGAWRVYARMEVKYNGKRFSKIELHPDNPNSFNGNDGTVCNFQWKLTGEKPAPMTGYYGGLVNLYYDPNSDLYDVENIEFTFTPDGPLLDGSTGKEIKAKSGLPRSEFYSKINDIPMGRYRVTAKHLPSGKYLKLSNYHSNDQPTASILIDFEPELNFCDRCMAIMFTDR